MASKALTTFVPAFDFEFFVAEDSVRAPETASLSRLEDASSLLVEFWDDFSFFFLAGPDGLSLDGALPSLSESTTNSALMAEGLDCGALLILKATGFPVAGLFPVAMFRIFFHLRYNYMPNHNTAGGIFH